MPSEEDIEWINSVGFSYVKHPELGNLLIENKKLTQELADASGKFKYDIFILGLPGIAGLIKNTDDLLVLVEIARAASGKSQFKELFVYGLPSLTHLIKNSDDLRNIGLVLVEHVCARKNDELKHFMNDLFDIVKIGLIRNIDDLRAFIELALALGKTSTSFFKFDLPKLAHLIKNTDDLHSLVELAVLGGKKYTEIFLRNEDWIAWFIKERRSNRKISLKDCLLTLNRLKFPGFKEELYAKIDPRTSLTKHPDLAMELFEKAQNGRDYYRKWYEEFNKKRIETMVKYGIDINLWLGKKRFAYKDVNITVVSVSSEKVVQEQLPQLKEWLNYLLDTVNDPKFVLAEIIQRLPKQPREVSIDAVIELFMSSPKAIPAFIKDIIFNIVKEKPDITCIPEKDLRKLITGFYGKAIATYKARKEKDLAELMQVELQAVSKMHYDQLLESLPKLKVMPYLQTRLKEFTKANPKQGKESMFTQALHELERIAQAIINLIAIEDKEEKTHFEGEYDLRFRVSDKFPTEVLTIGADGHACIQPGGSTEAEGHNFYRDVDAVLIEILTMHECKSRVFRVFKQFERLGFALIFAAVDSQNRPILALNTIELPKLWPAKIQGKFFDAMINWLVKFAQTAGFAAIMIGSGYGSTYFRNKYGEQDVYFKKMNPYPTEIKYYTNAFEHGQIRKTSQGLVLEYSGKGAIIWKR